jgi:hypothetical protein
MIDTIEREVDISKKIDSKQAGYRWAGDETINKGNSSLLQS